MNRSAKFLVTTVFLMAALHLTATRSCAQCGCMDLSFVIDDTGSMGGAISNVQASLTQIINIGEFVSGGDLRVGLITFPNDNVVLNVPLTTDTNLVEAAINGLTASGGNGIPESSDEALQYAITGAADSSCTVSNVTGAPYVPFRPACVKIAVLVTDAPPGGCDDTFTVGVDDVHAHAVAEDAANAGVKIASVYVPTGGEQASIKAIMEDYANVSDGVFVETQSDGKGAGDGIAGIVGLCGSISSNVITRTSQFWFTHGYSSDPTCATLLNSILINGGVEDLGFVVIPTANENADNVINATDAFIEALSFYYKSAGKTGETGGTQNQGLSGSKLCKVRKQLAVELIAAFANVRYLGTQPQNATYKTGGVFTNFPANLIQLAQTVAAGFDIKADQNMTKLLKAFNNSGTTNNLPRGLIECSPQARKTLKPIALDPMTQDTCPGKNNSCSTAEVIAFSTGTNIFEHAVFTETVNINTKSAQLPSLSCGTGGRSAVWKILPTTGTTNRQFSVSTDGSNFSTMVGVFSGDCSNLVQVTCGVSAIGLQGAALSFNTDGTNTFFIVGEGIVGQFGRLKIRITSP